MKARSGFTLIEMLIVIVIIVILAGVSVALLGVFLRGQGVRQGAAMVSQALAQCKQEAARKHHPCILVFSGSGQDARLELHEDRTLSGVYRPDADHPPIGERILLPKHVLVDQSPAWVVVSPSGYMTFSPGFPPVQASSFDANMNGPTPSALGDVVLGLGDQAYKVCINFDRASGKVRRSFFLN
jgi:prepilin-type N-terminal cleavage/methylation domain-containing protein